MELVNHLDPPSWYFPVAWDLILADDDDDLDALADEALRGYDHYELVRALALCTVVFALDQRFTEHIGEFLAPVLLSTLGMMFLGSSEDLLMLFVAR